MAGQAPAWHNPRGARGARGGGADGAAARRAGRGGGDGAAGRAALLGGGSGRHGRPARGRARGAGRDPGDLPLSRRRPGGGRRVSRDLALDDIREGLAEIARRRRLACWVEEQRRVPAVRCDAALSRRLGDALAEEGLGVRELASGAGRDAMAIASLCPAGMLLVRCHGAARRPGEWVTVDDCETGAARARALRARLPGRGRGAGRAPVVGVPWSRPGSCPSGMRVGDRVMRYAV